MSFRFKGKSSVNYLIVEQITRSLLPPVTNNLVEVPNRRGAYYRNNKLGVGQIRARIRIRRNSGEELSTALRTIAEWLYSENLEKLVLDKEPDKYYMAVLDGSTDLEEIVRIGKGDITFICPDPLAYDSAETLIGLTANPQTITIGGTYKTFPIIKATFKAATSFFTYSTDRENEWVLLGNPNSSDASVRQKYELTESYALDNLTGWSATGTTIDGGTVTGTMIVNSGNFTYGDTGTGPDWHGPAVKRGLKTTLKNFRVEADFTHVHNLASEISRIELYLFDVNGANIGKIAVKDNFAGWEDTWVEARAGNLDNGYYFMNSNGHLQGSFNDMSRGLLRIQREGKSWIAYVASVDSKGNHEKHMEYYYFDANDRYSGANLAQIEIHIGFKGTYPAPAKERLSVNDLRIYKINDLTTNEVPSIAAAGDVIEINHNTKQILKNGENFKEILSPVSQLFALKNGENRLVFSPDNVADVQILYQSRWL